MTMLAGQENGVFTVGQCVSLAEFCYIHDISAARILSYLMYFFTKYPMYKTNTICNVISLLYDMNFLLKKKNNINILSIILMILY